jgi:hypothetical protein
METLAGLVVCHVSYYHGQIKKILYTYAKKHKATLKYRFLDILSRGGGGGGGEKLNSYL